MQKKLSKLSPVPYEDDEEPSSPRYDISICKAGTTGCSHAVINPQNISDKIKELLDESGLGNHISAIDKKKLLYHKKFRVALAACPNSCPQPQIKDFGVSGQAVPVATDEPCSECMQCVDVCKEEGAVCVKDAIPIFNYKICVYCGDCEKICPTGSITNERVGMRVMAGGRLGRHPRLAMIMDDMADEGTLLEILRDILDKYIKGLPPFKPRRK